MSAYNKLSSLRHLHRAVLQGRVVVCGECVVGEPFKEVGCADWPCSSALILFSEQEITDTSATLIASAPPIQPRSAQDSVLNSHIAAIWGPAVQEQLKMSTEMLHHLAGEQAVKFLAKPMQPFVRFAHDDTPGRYDFQGNNTSDGWEPLEHQDAGSRPAADTNEKGDVDGEI